MDPMKFYYRCWYKSKVKTSKLGAFLPPKNGRLLASSMKKAVSFGQPKGFIGNFSKPE